MGWASGSELGESLWKKIRDKIPEENREFVARSLIDELEDQDCDTIYECEQLVIDANLEERYWPDDE